MRTRTFQSAVFLAALAIGGCELEVGDPVDESGDEELGDEFGDDELGDDELEDGFGDDELGDDVVNPSSSRIGQGGQRICQGEPIPAGHIVTRIFANYRSCQGGNAYEIQELGTARWSMCNVHAVPSGYVASRVTVRDSFCLGGVSYELTKLTRTFQYMCAVHAVPSSYKVISQIKSTTCAGAFRYFIKKR